MCYTLNVKTAIGRTSMTAHQRLFTTRRNAMKIYIWKGKRWVIYRVRLG